MAVADDGFPIGTLPAVQLHTTASHHQCPTPQDESPCHPVSLTSSSESPGHPVHHHWISTCVAQATSWHPPDIGFSAAGASNLIAGQVGVMGGGDEVVAQGLAHVLVYLSMLLVEDVTSS